MGLWKSLRHRVEVMACQVLLRGVVRLNRRQCLGFSQLLGACVYHLDSRGRKVALANLQSVFPNKERSWHRQTARRSYQNFARTMLDLFWSKKVGKNNFSQFIEVNGFQELMERACKEGRGVVFACAHLGNWEWAGLAFAHIGGQASIVAQDFKNPALTGLFAQMRSHGKHKLISQAGAMLRLLKTVIRGGNTALLADLTLLPHQGPTVLKAFGPEPLEICATQMHAVLAQRGNALLVPVLTEPQPHGRVLVTALPPIETAGLSTSEIAQKTWDVFEKAILAKPELWLWPYKHFRFRPKNARRPYPFYSSVSEAFDSIRDTGTT
ncbi:MAG: hypothetical protein RLZZ399_1853 [Verrucomicrobiota bacterium]